MFYNMLSELTSVLLLDKLGDIIRLLQSLEELSRAQKALLTRQLDAIEQKLDQAAFHDNGEQFYDAQEVLAPTETAGRPKELAATMLIALRGVTWRAFRASWYSIFTRIDWAALWEYSLGGRL